MHPEKGNMESTVRKLPHCTVLRYDDEPAPGTAWLPAYAASLGGPTPVIALLPEGTPKERPVSNAKARKAGWTPAHPTWREGFTHLHARGARDGENHAQEESAS
jgi:hypothetical protein